MDACVKTLVVSWKDAAESQLSVDNAARVIPRRIGLEIAGLASSTSNSALSSLIN